MLEDYSLKDIEKCVYGVGTACPIILCKILEKCIFARKEVRLFLVENVAEEFLDMNGYDDEFINGFLRKLRMI